MRSVDDIFINLESRKDVGLHLRTRPPKDSSILWVDLRVTADAPGLLYYARSALKTVLALSFEEIRSLAMRQRLHYACFEFDYPDRQKLGLLQATLSNFPSLPVVMFTQTHSEALAVWAFRCGVLDYVVTPISHLQLREFLARLDGSSNFAPVQRSLYRPLPIPAHEHISGAAPPRQRTGLGLRYIANNLDGCLSLDVVASLCRLSRSEFSRVFHREHGVSFRDYALRRRIERAQNLLGGTATSITDVASAVGFGDLAQFSRMFHRLIGMSPSTYRKGRHEA